MHEWIARETAAESRARAAAIERAAEQALQDGVCGVLVDEERYSASPSLAVPYGECHYIGRPKIGWRR